MLCSRRTSGAQWNVSFSRRSSSRTSATETSTWRPWYCSRTSWSVWAVSGAAAANAASKVSILGRASTMSTASTITPRDEVGHPSGVIALVELLERNGFVAAEEEAEELHAAAGGDAARLKAMVARRLTGEPLAWITGTAPFC